MKQSCKFIFILKYVMKSFSLCKILIRNCYVNFFCVFDIFHFLDYVFNVQQTAYVCMSSRSILPCVQSGCMSKHTDGKIFLLSENLQLLTSYFYQCFQEEEVYPTALYYLLECIIHFCLSVSIFIIVSCTIERHQVILQQMFRKKIVL